MIHYHGTPLTPRSALMTMAGKHFCVSFANPQDVSVCLQIGQSVMFDNGAFTAFRQERSFDMRAYAEWLEERLAHPHWAVIPDAIGGDEDAQRALVADWAYPPALSAPVWHLGLSLDYLIELSGDFPRICFGSSSQYWQVGSPDWCRRVDAAFNALARAARLVLSGAPPVTDWLPRNSLASTGGWPISGRRAEQRRSDVHHVHARPVADRLSRTRRWHV